MCDISRQYEGDEVLDKLLTKLKMAVNDGSKNSQNLEITHGKWVCKGCHSCNDTEECLKCTHKGTPNTEVSIHFESSFNKSDDFEQQQYDIEKDILVQAGNSMMFFKLYCLHPNTFLHDQFLTLTTIDVESLCENGAEFNIIPAKYPLSVVFMSTLDRKWIRFSKDKETYTKFRFKQANHLDKEKKYLHIESVNRPKYYLTMGFRGWWVRAKYHDTDVMDDAAFWDIRCLKTNDGKGNILSKYMLASKNSNYFVCVDRTNRLKGSDGNLDVSKMFNFKRVE